MGDDTDLGLVLDVHRTPCPFDLPMNEMETLALASYIPPSYKHVVVNMRGVNGNTFVIIGTVKQALKKAGASPLDLFIFVGECIAHDYEHALATVAKWVTITDAVPEPYKNDAWSAFVDCATKDEEN